MISNTLSDKSSVCPACLRPGDQCFCSRVTTVDNRIAVLILQFPREQNKPLNSAKLTSMVLKNSRLRIGLSWPNFSRALGRPAVPGKWGVLYLGSDDGQKEPIKILDRKKRPILQPVDLEGIVALDGSWKQAKTLWWRNPWLLKLNRIVLKPLQASLRPQVKNQALSTAEAVASGLCGLGENPDHCELLRKQYQSLIILPNQSIITN
jgi:DTW domain-containing protein YfiP